jgi:hypothetical protein
MTKTIVLGEQPPKKTELKPIKFCRTLVEDGTVERTPGDASKSYKFLELVSREYGTDNDGEPFDLIFAYQNPQERGLGILYLGQWNDGVVN